MIGVLNYGKECDNTLRRLYGLYAAAILYAEGISLGR